MEFVSVIKDELGEVVRYCSNYSNDDNENFLAEHIECYMSVEEVYNDEFNY